MGIGPDTFLRQVTWTRAAIVAWLHEPNTKAVLSFSAVLRQSLSVCRDLFLLGTTLMLSEMLIWIHSSYAFSDLNVKIHLAWSHLFYHTPLV